MPAKHFGPPVRLQLRRAKGFNLQAVSLETNGRDAVNCARPGPWGNPFYKNADDGAPMSAQLCAGHFRHQLLTGGYVLIRSGGKIREVTPASIVERLAGKNLACFCPLDTPHCHCVTLLEVANGH